MRDSSPPRAPSSACETHRHRRAGWPMAACCLLPAEVAAIYGACVCLALELLGLGTGMRMGLGEGDDAGVCRGLGKEGACRRFAAGSVGGDGTSICLP